MNVQQLIDTLRTYDRDLDVVVVLGDGTVREILWDDGLLEGSPDEDEAAVVALCAE